MRGVLLLFGVLWAPSVLGEIFSYEDWDMKVDEVHEMKSPGYPEAAPLDTRHVWTIRTQAKAVLVINCDHFQLAPEPCGENGFLTMEGSINKKVCGTKSSFQYVTSTSSLYASFIAKTDPDSKMSCTVKSVRRKDMPGYDPLSEKEDLSTSYLDLSSEEVNSMEFGGPEGPKKTTCECGWANKDERARIFFGQETKVNEYPFMVALVRKDWPAVSFCGGSLISAYHALTAAHCVHNDMDELAIVVGDHNLEIEDETDASQVIGVKEVIRHEGYEGQPKYLNDIALLALEEKVEFNRYVGPVCLPPPDAKLTHQYVTVMGWGATESLTAYEPMLKSIHVRVLSKSACHAARQPWVPPGSPQQLCVYATKRSACYGDSGGPVVWVDPETNRYAQIGINSYGVKGCATIRPIVITDVSTYIDWIHEKMRATNPLGITCKKSE